MLADGNRRCNCNSNWTGDICDIGVAGPRPRVVDEAGVSTVAIIIIILCILLVIGKDRGGGGGGFKQHKSIH